MVGTSVPDVPYLDARRRQAHGPHAVREAEVKPVRVYRLLVIWPLGSDQPGWEPSGWEHDPHVPFVWPRVHDFLSRSGAEKRAELLRSYGCEVTVLRSKKVEW